MTEKVHSTVKQICSKTRLNHNDIIQIKAMNLTESQIEEQLSFLVEGFPFMEIKAPAIVEKGIMRLTEEQQESFICLWDNYLTSKNRIVKFVPASGAASRMFKDLYSFLSAFYDTPTTTFEKTFFDGITHFAFYEALNKFCTLNEGKGIVELMGEGKYKDIILNLLEKKGLNYGAHPKGMVLFHKSQNGVRTAIEEHLAEGAMYAKNIGNCVTLHFTVLKEHLSLFKQLVNEKKPFYEALFAVKFDISFSIQQSSTETIAVDMANVPLRDVKGLLVFRPGGHGALIQNLTALDADVVFMKNIDNVEQGYFKEVTVRYKKVIAGILVSFQKRIFDYVRLIESGNYTHKQIKEMISFLQNELYIKNFETKYLEDAELVLYIKRKLMRPLRVCGMVENEDLPGGGPFFAVNPDGTVSPQILEYMQIDMNNPESKKIFEQCTHFNPVDLVCALKDVNGKKYHLPDYVDKNTGFIAIKSKDGHELKALELPGLWNGAMSDWNTVFVEVPIETFNPVKAVNDLLSPQHQAEVFS